ncbi:hypothetical protein ACWD6P_28575 [Streptomyces sp. NPDC002446]
MFSRKKIAAVSALLGGLALTFAGAHQAYAEGPLGNCVRDITGNLSCVQKNTGYTSADGRYSLKQSQDCLTAQPLTWPAQGLLNTGNSRVGPNVTCSNTAPAPGEHIEA